MKTSLNYGPCCLFASLLVAAVAVALAAPPVMADITETEVLGGDGGGKFRDAPEQPAWLVGFRVTTPPGGQRILKSMQPIYQTDAGRVESKVYGQPAVESLLVEAKEGYAVAGLAVKWGTRLDGFRVIFMRKNGDVLDPNDRYESRWVGGRGGGPEKPIGGDGKLVIGVHGRCGLDLDAIGLIQR